MIADEYAKYMPLVTSGVMSPERMIECIYGTVVGHEKEIEYIYEQLSAPAMPDMNPLYEGDETGKPVVKVDDEDE